MVLPFLGGTVKNTQTANQIAEFLEGQYLKKDLMDCLDILHA